MVTVEFIHFGYKTNDGKWLPCDTTKIWAVAELPNGHSVCGYISNYWNITDFSNIQHVECSIVKEFYKDLLHHTNLKARQYSSIADYLNNPLTKINCTEYFKDRFNYAIKMGDPTKLKYNVLLSEGEKSFTLDNTIYDIELPYEWYSDLFSDVGKRLYNCDVFENLDDVDLEPDIDLFGERYFPVVSFPYIDYLECYRFCVEMFTNRSRPIVHKDRVFYGLRVKPIEWHQIKSVYDNQGKILRNAKWEWET